MKKRLIGGTGFVVLFYSSLLFGFFNLLALAFLVVGLYELYRGFKTTEVPNYPYLVAYGAVYIVGVLAMYTINDNSPLNLGLLITMIMVNDSFAYLVGRKIGKTKFSKTSPNKSVEGLIGGIVSSLLVFAIANTTLDLGYTISVVNIILYVVLMLAAVVGDLAESKFKRNADIKDSGTIIYGHGGILDRIDSWVFAAIFMLII